MDVSDKIFINPAWTAASKVPATSERGVELVYGVNAFASIADAEAALGSLDGKGIYLREKAVKLDSSDKYGMISSQEPYARESYKTGATGFSDALEVKLGAAADISITDGDSDMLVQGYKNVDIVGTANYVIVGGNNAASRAYSYNDKGGNTSEQLTESINASAAGNLNVKGAAFTAPGFIFDYSDDTIGWFSTETTDLVDITPALLASYGYPIASYSNVTLVGATGADFNGGNFKGGQTRTVNNNTDGSYSYNYKGSYGYGAAGRLTLTQGSTLSGTITGYADVSVVEASAFETIDGATRNAAAESYDVYSVKGSSTSHTIGSKSSATRRSAGRFTVDASIGSSIEGYATVTITDSTIGTALGGSDTSNSTGSAEEVINGSAQSNKSASNNNASAALTGTLTAVDSEIGDVIGYNRVALTDTDVTGTIAATDSYGLVFNQTNVSNATSATNAAGDETETYDNRSSRSENSTGAVTVVGGKVDGGIIGYSSVNLTDSELGGNVKAGSYRIDETTSYKRVTKGSDENITSTFSGRETENAVGTLTATATVGNGAAIDGFQNVNLTNVTSAIGDVTGGNTDGGEKSQFTSVNGITAIKFTDTETESANGSFVAKNTSDVLEAGDITGYGKVQLTLAKTGAIIGGNTSATYAVEARNLEDPSTIVTPFSSDYVEGVETSSYVRKMTGSVVLDTAETADIDGYASITLVNSSVVDGDINTSDPLSTKSVRDYRRNVESQYVSEGKGPATALTLKQGATVTGMAYNISKLTMEADTALGGVDMLTSNSMQNVSAVHAAKGDLYDSKYSENIAPTGALTINSGTTIGTMLGVKSVNVTSATIGDLEAYTYTTSSIERGVSKPGDVLTIDGGISDPTALAQYESSVKTGTLAVGVASLKAAAVGDLTGFSKVNAVDTDLTGAIEGGKNTLVNIYKMNNTEKGGAEVITETSTTSDTKLAQGTVTATNGSVAGAKITGFQNVTLTQVTGAADAMIGGSSIYGATGSQCVSSGVSTYKNVASTTVAAAGGFTATGVTSETLTFAEIDGFTNVKLTSAGVEGNIIATNYTSKTTTTLDQAKGGYSYEDSFASKYTGNAEITADPLDGIEVGGDINGYAKVTVDGVTVDGAINASHGILMSKDTTTVRYNVADDSLLSFSGTYSSSTAATTTLTLKNAAVVAGAANGIGKLTMGPLTAVGDVDMYSYSLAGNRTIAFKNSGYNGSEKSSSTQVATGAAIITGASGFEAVAGSIVGAKSVSASWATVGNITAWDMQSTQQREAANVLVDSDYSFDNGVSGSSKSGMISTAKAKVTLTDATAGVIQGASSVDVVRGEIVAAYGGTYRTADQGNWTAPDSAYWKGNYESLESAIGGFNASSANVTGGDIAGFAKVTLTSAAVNGSVAAGSVSSKIAYNLGSGTVTETDTVVGTLTAVDTVIAGNVEDFATAKLANTLVNGDVYGGNWTLITDYETGSTIDEKFAAAGTLAGSNAAIGGSIYDLKTVTFEGTGLVAGQVIGVTELGVKNGVTAIYDADSYIGSEGSDIVAIDKNGILELTKMDFGDGKDKLTVGGTIRVLGADDTTLVNLEQLAGNGLFAVTNAYYTGDLATALNGVAVDKALTFVDAGDEVGVKSIRTKAEELGDNGGRALVMADDAVEFTGWLCADEDYGFVDAVDWVSFTKNAGDSLAFSVTEDTYSDSSLLKATLYKNGVEQGTDVGGYDLTSIADGSYELKLEFTDKTGPLAYAVTATRA